MLKASFISRPERLMSYSSVIALAVVVAISTPGSVTAAGGSWGGSGGFGSGGGSWGGSGGSSWGGSGGGSFGGSRGGLFGGRRPIRNLLGRIASRIGSGSHGSGGSRGGSFGGSLGGSHGGSGGGSYGGSTGGWSGGSMGSTGGYFGGSSGASYGSWGSGYASSLSYSGSYVSNEITSPVYAAPAPVMSQPYVDTSSLATQSIAGCPTCAGTASTGIPVDQGLTETSYSSDTGFHDGSMPNYDGSGLDDGTIYDPGISSPTDYYDGGDSLLDDGGTPPPPGPAGDDSAQAVPKADADTAILSIALPRDAKVYINGQLTKTEGAIRNYVARRLSAGKEHGYQIKAVIERDGKRLVRTRSVNLKRGFTQTVEIDFDKPVTTMLALKVPENAKVRLCGAETSATGEHRFFETSKLKDGDSWDDYEIEVVVNRNGKELIARKTLSLHAGDSRSIVFDFQDQTGKLIARK